MGFKTKIKTSSPKILNAWLLFATIMVITLLLLFYSFVYVKNNEEKQIEKRFRVLNQMRENVVAREKGFRSIAINAAKGAQEKLGSIYFSLGQALDNEIRETNKLLRVAKEDSIRGNFIIKLREVSESPFIIFIRGEDFFYPLRRPDVFSDLLVLEVKEVYSNEGEEKEKRDEVAVLYHSFSGYIGAFELEKLKKTEYAIESAFLTEIRISNKDYKLFLQPLRLTAGSKWYLGGLIETDKFAKETRGLKAGVIIIFFIGFFILILIIPFLKLFLMSNFEPLDIKDVVLTSISVTLGTVALILIYVLIFQANYDAGWIRKNLKTFAQQIEKNFTIELEAACKQLKIYDSSPVLMGYNLEIGNNFGSVLTNPAIMLITGPREGSDNNEQSSIVSIFHSDYGLFKNLFWLDHVGQQVLQFTTRNYAGPLVNLGFRKYFQEAGKWQLPGVPSIEFMLESITSVTSGEKLAAISMRSNLDLTDSQKSRIQPPVVVMTTQLISLMDTILPPGYGFCIIDKAGSVWFHSNSEINHQENFFNEVGYNEELRSAIRGDQVKYLDLDYHNKNHKCFIIPVSDIPLFIITFHDMTYTSSVQNLVIKDTIFAMGILFAFNGLLLVAAAYKNCKKSRLKRKFVPFEWLRLRKEKQKHYQHVTFSNLIIILFLVIFTQFTELAGALVFCILASLISFAYSHYIITGKQNKKYLLPFSRWLKKLKNDKPLIKIASERSYFYFLLSWLVLVCVIPLIEFYIDAYHNENEVALRHFQTQLAEQIEARNLRIDKFFNEKIHQPEHPAVKAVKALKRMKNRGKISGIYANIHYDTNWGSEPADFARARRIPDNVTSGGSRTWKKYKDKLYLKYKIKNYVADDIYIESTIKSFKMPLGLSLLSVLAICLLLVIAYYLIRFSARMIFGLNLPGDKSKRRTYIDAQNEIRECVQAGLNVFLYCQTMKEMEYCLGLFCEETEKDGKPTGKRRNSKKPINVNFIDINSDKWELPEVTNSKSNKIVLIKNFQLHLNDIDGNLKKINHIITLLRSPNIQVIIPTLTPLEKMIEYCDEELAELSDEEKKLQSKKTIAELYIKEMGLRFKKLKNMMTLLNSVNDCFVPLYMPLKTIDKEKIKDKKAFLKDNKIEEAHIQELIAKEFAAAEYFTMIEQNVYRCYKELKKEKEPVSEEKIILKIQELAQHYYDKLLNSCTREEKIILYDIAQDMLLNPNNTEVINILVKKGLLVYDGTLKIMNESFRNFILSSIKPDEVRRYMKTLYPKWKNYKVPLFLIALGAAVFIAFQENLLDKVQAIVTTVIGGIAIITKFSGLFFNFPKSSSK